MLNFDKKKLIQELREAEEPVKNEEAKEEKLIEQEVIALMNFVSEIAPFTTRKKISGKDSYLIYVFDSSNNDTISNDVYLSSDAFVRYQVYDEKTYRGYVPDATIVEGHAVFRVDHFLKSVPLYKIFDFFEKRPSVLKEKEFSISERVEKRTKFLKDYQGK